MNRKNASAVHVSFVIPEPLKTRLVRRAAKETGDCGKHVSMSEIAAAAIEEYLDLYEGATFVPESADAPKETPPPRSP